MWEAQERRATPRTTLRERPPAGVPGLGEVRLLDLSRTGAQIEHLDLVRPGAACALDLPLPFIAPPLPAQVVWCTVIGRQRTLGGESHLLSHTGLRFTRLTGAQHAALADTLQHLATALQPLLDSQQRTA